jgi:hypothetical protein
MKAAIAVSPDHRDCMGSERPMMDHAAALAGRKISHRQRSPV